ncbi:2Fe-2S iron-sulfur cluster binding domain-containing protein [Brevibacillus sp. FSL K6-0770]|uniref:2Fe-2S iron-sulfur cluster-binding protein n=1 Tax=Brevibacillus TaxID=55080 RepID=UPI001C21D9F9|nr:2Fe-2S iron-sulfur cluster binding domain-containing protein [Brevibacillus parabrevis]
MEDKRPQQFAGTVWENGRQHSIAMTDGENLLMALVRAQMPIDFFCTTGKCRTCMVRANIPAGSAPAPSATEQYRLGDAAQKGYRLACQVYVSGPLTVFLDSSGSA